MDALFEEVKEELGGVQKEKFIAFSREVDFAVEIGCEYASTSLVKELEMRKAEGKTSFRSFGFLSIYKRYERTYVRSRDFSKPF